ncbi:MAG: hypothetical protein ACYSUI_02510 [Planctomycetota bacterium]|jgi:hypothetical protein
MNRTATPPLSAILAPVTACLALAGCVKRAETIKVEPDGTVELHVAFIGDPEDVRDGDAVLNDAGSWTVEDKTRAKKDGGEELARVATLTIPPGREIPTHYAGGDAELAELALTMSTSLRTEERPDGAYYHFRRVYHRRPWARIAYFRHKLMDEPLEELDGGELDELSKPDQEKVAHALVSFETLKTIVLAEVAAEALDPPLHQDDWLGIHQAIKDVFGEIGTDRVLELLQMDGDEAEAEIEREVQQVNALIERRTRQILARRDPSGVLGQDFMDGLDRERQRQSISEDLQDEDLTVNVQLPGRLLGHNGDTVEEGMVQWKFGCDAFNDRDHVLLATSVLTDR